jgi:subtilisin family serine protease
MRHAAVLCGLLLFPGCPPNTGPTPPPTGPGYDCAAQPAFRKGEVVRVANAIAGRYIVTLRERPAAPLRSLLHAASVGVTDVKTTNRGYAAQIAATALQRILADPEVAWVQEDGVKSVSPIPAALTPTWGLDRVDQRDLPLNGDYTPGADAALVNVAIVDTGVTPHPDFEGRLQLECFTAHAGGCSDFNGHGTHVAGTIGGKTWGVAKKARLWASRVLDGSGSGSDSDVIRGIEWVTAKKLANPAEDWVINMSLGGGASPALDRTTCDSLASGVIVVVASGNEHTDASGSSPARVRQAITVGASDRNDRQATFSNFGPLLDLYGPGVDIQSTQPNGGTATFSGTSMAAPHVAGGAALYLARHPGASPQDVRDGLVLLASHDKLSGLGSGSPNALLYVRAE